MVDVDINCVIISAYLQILLKYDPSNYLANPEDSSNFFYNPEIVFDGGAAGAEQIIVLLTSYPLDYRSRSAKSTIVSVPARHHQLTAAA
jgi:hypothetical protein